MSKKPNREPDLIFPETDDFYESRIWVEESIVEILEEGGPNIRTALNGRNMVEHIHYILASDDYKFQYRKHILEAYYQRILEKELEL